MREGRIASLFYICATETYGTKIRETSEKIEKFYIFAKNFLFIAPQTIYLKGEFHLPNIIFDHSPIFIDRLPKKSFYTFALSLTLRADFH
jgi:hypothetical protein